MQEIAVWKKRIQMGEQAETAAEYIMPILKSYRAEIMQNLEKGENIRKLQGMAYIIKKLEQDILRDISHKNDAKIMMKKIIRSKKWKIK